MILDFMLERVKSVCLIDRLSDRMMRPACVEDVEVADGE